MRNRLLLLALVATACQTRLCRDPTVWTPVEYVAPKTAAPPAIDGKLDDPAWQAAPWTPAWNKSNRNEAPRQQTRAKLLWDDTTLYVAFEVEDDAIVTPYAADDEPLYQSEVVEIFLDADEDGRTYNEIELSPRDVLFDASFRARRQGMNVRWSSGARHAVHVDGTVNDASDTDRGWTAELAVPLATLAAVPRLPPLPGDRWRLNLFRLDHEPGVEGQAFSPVMANDFHNLPKYGTLVFGAAP